MSHPPGFLPPREARAYNLARRRAPTLTVVRVVDDIERCHRQHGRATPSVEGMARRCHRSERSVIRATGWLEAAGYLAVVRDRAHCRADGTWRRARTNLYRIRFPDKRPGRTDMTRVTRLSPHAIQNGPSEPDSVDNSPERAPPDPPDGDAEVVDRPTRPPWIAAGQTAAEWCASNVRPVGTIDT